MGEACLIERNEDGRTDRNGRTINCIRMARRGRGGGGVAPLSAGRLNRVSQGCIGMGGAFRGGPSSG